MGTAACELRRSKRNPTFAFPSSSFSANVNGRSVANADSSGWGLKTMRIEVHEAEASTSKRPLWVWRVWRNGRLIQGFSSSENDARRQAELAQHPGHGRCVGTS